MRRCQGLIISVYESGIFFTPPQVIGASPFWQWEESRGKRTVLAPPDLVTDLHLTPTPIHTAYSNVVSFRF